MGHRTFKRVPMDFSWPLHKVWDGYLCKVGGPCPEEGKTCFNGSTAAGVWLDRVARLIAMLGDEAAVAPRAEEFSGRRIYPHPYLEEWGQAPRYEMPRGVSDRIRGIENQAQRMAEVLRYSRENPPKLLPLTEELVQLAKGLGVREPGSLSSDSYYVAKKLRETAGLPKTWGTCPVCEGNADDPEKRAAAEAWTPTEPPTGDGWQLWETCSEGSPVSPVFATREDLARWCVDGATTFASCRATYDQWMRMLGSEDACEVGSLFIVNQSTGESGAAIEFDDDQ